MNPRSLLFFATCLFALGVSGEGQQTISNASPVGIYIASEKGLKSGLARETSVSNFIAGWTPTLIDCIFIPENGHALAGYYIRTNVVLLGDALFGVQIMPHTPFLGIFTSTNSYLELAETPEAAMDAEVASFMQNIRSRHSFRVPIQMDLKVAFGTSMFLQGTPYANGDKILMAYSSSDLGEAKLLGIAVKGADAVVTVGGIGNNVCQVAFDKHVRPVWAKTNGVAITPIPTNCVYSFETVSNRVVRSLIY